MPSNSAFSISGNALNVPSGGTVGGRDLATDGSKLDGVAANADVTTTALSAALGVTSGLMLAQLAAAMKLAIVVDVIAASDIASLAGLSNTVDGVAINADGMRVLAPSQANPTQDAIYVAHSGAWTLASEMPSGSHASGKLVVAKNGSSNKGLWVCTNASPSDVVGTNNLTFDKVASLGSGGGPTYDSGQVTLAGGAGATVVYSIPTQATTSPGVMVKLTIMVVARDSSGDLFEEEIRLSYTRATGGHPVIHAVGTNYLFANKIPDDPLWVVALAANNTTDAIDVSFTPDATNQTKVRCGVKEEWVVPFT